MKSSFRRAPEPDPAALHRPTCCNNRGAGGEIGFWIFDYPPEHEMQMRSWLAMSLNLACAS
jgi:hypothetical protein